MDDTDFDEITVILRSSLEQCSLPSLIAFREAYLFRKNQSNLDESNPERGLIDALGAAIGAYPEALVREADVDDISIDMREFRKQLIDAAIKMQEYHPVSLRAFVKRCQNSGNGTVMLERLLIQYAKNKSCGIYGRPW